MTELKCKLCKTKRVLSEEEIKESINIISKRNLKYESILSIWNIYDGETCPEGGTHEYEWDTSYFEKILNDAAKIKDKSTEIIRNVNENKEINIKIEKLKEETDKKINEMISKIDQNKEKNITLEREISTSEDIILKTTGRNYKEWL